VITEQVGDHPVGASDGKPEQDGALLGRHDAAVETHVGSAALTPNRERELVYVRPQVTDPVEIRRRGVRDDRTPQIAEPNPCGGGGIELEPRRPKPEMVCLAGAANAIHAMGDSFQSPVLDQASD
jgi:hypothetical protein